jgi:hypothetical protein
MEKFAVYLARGDSSARIAVIDGADETGQADALARELVEKYGADALAKVAEMLLVPIEEEA